MITKQVRCTVYQILHNGHAATMIALSYEKKIGSKHCRTSEVLFIPAMTIIFTSDYHIGSSSGFLFAQ